MILLTQLVGFGSNMPTFVRKPGLWNLMMSMMGSEKRPQQCQSMGLDCQQDCDHEGFSEPVEVSVARHDESHEL